MSLFVRIGVVFVGVLFSALVSAVDNVVFVDQHNKPIKDAVMLVDDVGLDERSLENVYVMDQIGKQFVPHVLVVPQGARIDFPNSDDIRHHVYSFSQPKSFELKLYSGKPNDPIIFDNEGLVVLGCNIHDRMVGYIVVSDVGVWGVSNDKGIVKTNVGVQGGLAGRAVRVWHPRLAKGKHQLKSIVLNSIDSDGIIRVNLNVLPAKDEDKTSKNRFKRYAR